MNQSHEDGLMLNDISNTLDLRRLFVLGLGTFALGLDGCLLSGLAPQIAAEFSVPTGTISQSVVLSAAAFAIAAPIVAAITERIERRTLLGIGMATCVVGILLQATAAQATILLAGSLLTSLGAAIYIPLTFSIAGLFGDTADRAKALAVIMVAASLALVAGVSLVTWASQLWGWRYSLWIVVLMAKVSTLLLRILPVIPGLSPQSEYLQVVSRAGVMGVFAVTMAAMVPTPLMITYLATIGHPSTVSAAMFALGLGGVAATTAAATIMYRKGAFFTAIAASSSVTLALAAHGMLISTIAPWFVIGGLNAITFIAQQHRLLSLVSPSSANFAIGLNVFAVFAGGGLGAAISGIIPSALCADALLTATILGGLLSIIVTVGVSTDAQNPNSADESK